MSRMHDNASPRRPLGRTAHVGTGTGPSGAWSEHASKAPTESDTGPTGRACPRACLLRASIPPRTPSRRRATNGLVLGGKGILPSLSAGRRSSTCHNEAGALARTGGRMPSIRGHHFEPNHPNINVLRASCSNGRVGRQIRVSASSASATASAVRQALPTHCATCRLRPQQVAPGPDPDARPVRRPSAPRPSDRHGRRLPPVPPPSVAAA